MSARDIPLSPAAQARPGIALLQIIWLRWKLWAVVRFLPARLDRVVAEIQAKVASVQGQDQ